MFQEDKMIEGYLATILTGFALILGFTVGWLCSERFAAYMMHESHEYDELFQKNPHPELFTEDGELDRGEYINIQFDPGYDPEQFDPDDIIDMT